MDVFLDLPVEAHIQLSTNCRGRCQVCPYWFFPDSPKLSASEIGHIFEQLVKVDIRHVLFLALDPEILECLYNKLELYFSLGMEADLLVCGPMPPIEFWHSLEGLGLGNVIFYLFGPKDIQDSLTFSGSYAQIYMSIKAALASNLSVVVACPVMKPNVGFLSELISVLPDDVKGVVFQYYLPFKLHQYTFVVSETQALNIYHEVKGKHSHRLIVWRSELRTVSRQERKFCTAGKFKAFINPRGDVGLCEAFRPSKETLAGNLLKSSLQKIWAKSDVFLLPEKLIESSQAQCSSCNETAYCSSCPALIYNWKKAIGPWMFCGLSSKNKI